MNIKAPSQNIPLTDLAEINKKKSLYLNNKVTKLQTNNRYIKTYKSQNGKLYRIDYLSKGKQANINGRLLSDGSICNRLSFILNFCTSKLFGTKLYHSVSCGHLSIGWATNQLNLKEINTIDDLKNSTFLGQTDIVNYNIADRLNKLYKDMHDISHTTKGMIEQIILSLKVDDITQLLKQHQLFCSDKLEHDKFHTLLVDVLNKINKNNYSTANSETLSITENMLENLPESVLLYLNYIFFMHPLLQGKLTTNTPYEKLTTNSDLYACTEKNFSEVLYKICMKMNTTAENKVETFCIHTFNHYMAMKITQKNNIFKIKFYDPETDSLRTQNIIILCLDEIKNIKITNFLSYFYNYAFGIFSSILSPATGHLYLCRLPNQ